MIIWGVDLAGRYAGSDAPLAYEQQGRDGVRLLITCAEQIQELNDGDFADLVWPDGYQPTP